MSSGANKPFYDRDDLDEEEKKLFDAMVIEEMEKLEKQFDSTSFENSRRDRQIPPSSINTDLNTRNSADDRPSYGRDRPSNASHQSEPTRNYPADYGSNDSSTIRSEEQPTRRVPRSSVVAENYPRPNEQPTNGMPFSPEKSNADKRYKQQEYARLLEEGSRPPNEEVDRHAVSRVARREESPPASRMESNISRIGANDLSMISPTQKRAQQAKYALQLAESDSRSLSYKNSPPKTDDNSARSKPRRVQSTEITIEDNNIISNIGQDSQLMKDRKKQQQQVYAQQLQSQQQHKLQQDSSTYSSRTSGTPRGQSEPSSNPYSPRADRSEYNYNEGPLPGKSSVVNFGPDPNAEAAKKREMKIAYARQLQEQQYKQQEPMNKPPPRTGSNYGYSDSVSDEQNSMRDHVIDDGRMNRDNLLSAKRQQQKQYHDEITRAAAAPAIYSERGSLRGGIESRRQQQLQSDGSNLRSNEQGTGLNLQIGGHSSSFLSSADAERLESRSRKVEQQQVYARQLTEDSNVTTGHSNYQSDTRSGRGSFSAGNNRSPTGGSYGDNGSSNDPRGGVSSGESLFGVMSERDQNAIATAKKRVAQAEYYQQLKEVDSKRSDSNSLPSQSRTTLYRSREQRENDDLATSSRGRDNDSSTQSRPRSNYDGDQNNNNGRGYQDQGYSLGAGPGYGSQSNAPQVRDRGDNELNSARRRQQDEYANALRSDSAVVPIADSYTAQRRSHHDREGPGSNRDGDRDRDNGYSSRQAGRDRDSDSQSMNRGGQGNDRPSERYQEREEREQPQYQDRGGREQARYQDREEREQPQYSDRGGREQPRYREREEQESEMGQYRDRNHGRTDSSSTYSPPMESTYQGPGPRPGSGNVSRPDPRNGGYNSSQGMSYRNQEGYCDEEATQYDSQRRGSQISSPVRNYESNSNSGQYEPLSPGQQYKKQHLFGADPHGTVTRQTGPIAQSDNSGPVAGNMSHRSRTEDFRGRGRSSGGGVSSISLSG